MSTIYFACTVMGGIEFPWEVGMSVSSAIDRCVEQHDRIVAEMPWMLELRHPYPLGKSRNAKWSWLRRHRDMKIVQAKFINETPRHGLAAQPAASPPATSPGQVSPAVPGASIPDRS